MGGAEIALADPTDHLLCPPECQPDRRFSEVALFIDWDVISKGIIDELGDQRDGLELGNEDLHDCRMCGSRDHDGV
jgi:hypothetical protein